MRFKSLRMHLLLLLLVCGSASCSTTRLTSSTGPSAAGSAVEGSLPEALREPGGQKGAHEERGVYSEQPKDGLQSAGRRRSSPSSSQTINVPIIWSVTSEKFPPGDLPLRRMPEASQQPFRYNSGITSTNLIEVRDPLTWKEQWLRITGGRGGSPPYVDFSSSMLLLAHMGSQPTGGYSITIERVVDRGSALQVHVVRASPGRRCGSISAVTEPMDVVLIPVRNGRVEWIVRNEIRVCP